MRLAPFLIISLFIGHEAGANPQATAALNALRSAKGQAPLAYSIKLEAAARLHAQDMAQHRYIAHDSRKGAGVGDRVRAQNYTWCFVAENLAKGPRDVQQVLQGWANSPPHFQNLISRQVQEFGLFQGPDRIWVMVLAAAC